MSTDGGGWTKLGSAQYPFFSAASWDQYGLRGCNSVYLTDLDDFAVNGTYTLRYVVGSSTGIGWMCESTTRCGPRITIPLRPAQTALTMSILLAKSRRCATALMVCTTITKATAGQPTLIPVIVMGVGGSKSFRSPITIGTHPVILKAMMDRTPTLGSQSGFAKVKPTAEFVVMHWLRGEDVYLMFLLYSEANEAVPIPEPLEDNCGGRPDRW